MKSGLARAPMLFPQIDIRLSLRESSVTEQHFREAKGNACPAVDLYGKPFNHFAGDSTGFAFAICLALISFTVLQKFVSMACRSAGAKIKPK